MRIYLIWKTDVQMSPLERGEWGRRGCNLPPNVTWNETNAMPFSADQASDKPRMPAHGGCASPYKRVSTQPSGHCSYPEERNSHRNHIAEFAEPEKRDATHT